MRKSILLGLLLIAISVPLLVSGCGKKTSDDIILASFDKHAVTASELEKEISELPKWKQDKYKDMAGREEYLTLMAESRMILQVAREKGLDKVQSINGEVKDFQEEIMRDKLTEMEVDDKVKVSDLDIEKYYAEHREDYVDPDRVVVTEITVKEENKAKEILDQVKAGADFTEIAKEIDAKGESFGPGQGRGGKTQPFSKDSYSSAKDFVEVGFSLKPGEIYDGVLVQPLGEDTYYMIIRQDEFMPTRQQELDEVRDDAKRKVEKEMKEKRRGNWIAKIKGDKKAEIFTDRIPADPEPQPGVESEDATKEKPVEKPETQPTEDAVLAKIGKDRISLSQINKDISEMQAWKQDRYKGKEGKTKYLDELIEEKLITLAAYGQKLQDDAEISRQVKEYKDQLMLKELVKQEVDDKIKIEDADIQKYYDEHKEDYVDPEKIVVTEVTLKDEEKAREILEQIKNGGDFTEIAKELDAKGESFGPGMGKEGKTNPFSTKSYSSAKEFTEIAFNLKVGEVSDLFTQPMGQETYQMIIRKDEEMPSRQKELDEVKDNVKREVEREKKRARIEEWLDGMKKEMKFEIFADKIPAPVVEEEKPKEEGATQKKAESSTDEGSAEKTDDSVKTQEE